MEDDIDDQEEELGFSSHLKIRNSAERKNLNAVEWCRAMQEECDDVKGNETRPSLTNRIDKLMA